MLPFNPALSERTARLVVTEGKTPVMEREEARALFASLDASVEASAKTEGGNLLALRDRAMFAVMLFGFVRIGALCKMSVRDFEDESTTAFLVLHEKGGKERRIPCHHLTREYLRAYIAAAGFEPRAKVPLFQSAPGRTGALSGKAIGSGKVWEAVKRRCRAAGLPSSISNHSFRATGITLHQENGGRLEDAQARACRRPHHAPLRPQGAQGRPGRGRKSTTVSVDAVTIALGSLAVSTVSLGVSAANAWLTLWRRGTVRMAQPPTVYFGPDGARELLPRDGTTYQFLSGTYRVELFAVVVGQKGPLKLHELELQVTEAQAAQLGGSTRCGLYFDWSPETRRFHGHIDNARPPDPSPLFFVTRSVLAPSAQHPCKHNISRSICHYRTLRRLRSGFR